MAQNKIDKSIYKQALNKAYLNLTKYPTMDNVLDVYSICEYLLKAYPKYYKECFIATDLCKKLLMEQPMFEKDKSLQKLWWQIIFLEGTNKNVDSGLIYLERYRPFEKQFYMPRRETFLKFGIIQSLQDLIDDKLDLLTISLAPRVGKTTLSMFFQTLLGGWYPERQVFSVSYSQSIVNMFYNGYLSIITDKYTYAWQEMFGKNVKLQGNNAKDTWVNLGEAKNFKTYTTRSIDGTITGSIQAGILLSCDDLVKNIEEAMNKNALAKIYQKYSTDLIQRKIKGAKELHIATRWSVWDVIGRIENQRENDERARFIKVPALNEKGESNFNYPMTEASFDTKFYLDIQEVMDTVSFNCLYQQEPVEREGLLFENEKMRRYFERPSTEPDKIWATCDTKDKGSDFVSMPIAYQYGEDFYIEDVVFTDSTDYDFVDNELANKLIEHKVNVCRFESNNAGGRVASDVQKILDERKARISLETKFTRTNKETKILTNSDWIIKHCLFKDESKMTKQYKDFYTQLITYTAKGKNPHDDACFEADTQIATLFGYKAIKDIKVGDLVITPVGLRKVINCGITGLKETCEFRGLKATNNHKVYNATKNDFIAIKDFKETDKINKLNLGGQIKWKAKLLYLMGLNILDTQRADIILSTQHTTKKEKTVNNYTEQFGFSIMAKFQKGITFITLTAMLTITTFLTWLVFQQANICRNIAKNLCKTKNIGQNLKKHLIRQEKKQQSGTKAKRAESGTENTHLTLSQKLGNTILKKFVNIAGKSIWGLSDKNIAQILVCKKQDGLGKKQKNKVPVYNLTIDKVGCYYANGILVSNCDSLAMMSEFVANGTSTIAEIIRSPI